MKSKIIALLLLATAATGVAAENPPATPQNVVMKPTFMTGYDSFSGGTAFLCSLAGHEGILLLTAQHLFGPACGLDREYTWQETPKLFIAVTGLSMSDPSHFVTSTNPLTIPGAHALNDSGYDKDLAGYRIVPDGKLSSLHLASSRPKPGDVVFLYARQRGKDALEFFRAIVRKSTDAEFEYAFDAADINIAGTSGAPVLNTSGEVVAVNIGGGKEKGKEFGFGNPCNSIAQLLKNLK